MAERKRLVLDANILIRACLGIGVRALIADFANEVDFYVAGAAAAVDHLHLNRRNQQ